jgi:4-diphosphocytidyl-2-C-methyl-D-erythritol kinase
MPIAIHSFAKINLGLRIGPVRADGFHELATVYQTIDLHDEVTVSATLGSKTAISIRCDDKRVPTDNRNTCWKIVAAALEAMGAPAQVEIKIKKNLPLQGGLGAGSANAAAALVALERELAGHARELSQDERLAIAAQTGSDVPLFLLGGTVWGRGRGELVTALADSPSIPCVVALPDCGVSTPQAFRDWDAAAASRAALTRASDSTTLNELNRKVAEVWRLGGASGVFSSGKGLAENPLLALVHAGIENDFESVVFPQQPRLRDLKLALAGSSPDPSEENQALYAALSGSGAALFGLYTSNHAADLAAERVRAMNCAALVTKTLSRT